MESNIVSPHHDNKAKHSAKRTGRLTRIHVNQHVIRSNATNGTNQPALSIRTYKGVEHAHEVEILGPSKIVYSTDKPLSCGARCWIETTSEVVLK